MSIKYKHYTDALMKSVRSGKSAARSVAEILADENMLQCVAEYNPELLSTSDSDRLYATESKIYGTFFRNITRKLNELVITYQDAESPSFLKIINNAERGFGKARFYWANDEVRNEALGYGSVSNTRVEARIFAFRFINAYLRDCFPPSLIEELKNDIEESDVDDNQFKELENKLRFWPTFIQGEKQPAVENHPHWRDVFDALINNRVFSATYDSMHKSVVPECVTLSPQRIQYINHDIKLFAFVHEINTYYSFQLDRLKNIQQATNVKYRSINWDQFEKHYDFEFRGADWAVNHLCKIGFGEHIKVTSNGGGTSKVTGKVLIPNHFNKQAPDVFDCVNFLSSFGDSLQVLKPDIVRAEFKRRAEAMISLYENDDIERSIQTLLESAHQQTSNNLMLGVYKKRYS
ncbi:WYL domain-containing protein [Pseudidiomarina sp. CB1]|uniref:WYL domain-containing protein n=1 Tax=Pseudidiomarina sp. CB1 TaxID=2972484 RepID=UPI002163A6DD|nr:WYL domain-containing protein [Pseudidiomarina sp. CB1]